MVEAFPEIVGIVDVPGAIIEIQAESSITQFADGAIQIVLNVKWLRADGARVGEAGLEFDTGARIAEVSNFHVAKQVQSKGLARAVIDSTAVLCERLDITQLVLTAKNIGRYAWASIGFDFETEEERDLVLSAAKEFASKLGVEVDLSRIECAQDFVDLPGNVPLEDLIGAIGGKNGDATGKRVSMGRALLLGPTDNEWYGVLSIPQRK